MTIVSDKLRWYVTSDTTSWSITLESSITLKWNVIYAPRWHLYKWLITLESSITLIESSFMLLNDIYILMTLLTSIIYGRNMFIVQATCAKDNYTLIVEAGNTGKYHCTIDLLFDWFGLVCFANKNKNRQLSYSWFQTIQTGGQWYSDTSPFSIPW